MMAFVALHNAVLAEPVAAPDKKAALEARFNALSEADSLGMMKERLRIANELLRAASGILGEDETRRAADFPVFRPGVRQDSVGEFVWLPDTLVAEWNQFVAEKRGERMHVPSLETRLAIPDTLIINPADMRAEPASPYDSHYVTFRGDTIPRVMKSSKLGRFDRGLFNYLYVPKGLWSFGLTASYGEISSKDMEIMDLLTGVTLHGNIFSISPSMQYFLKNNMAIGLKFTYSNGSAGVDSFNLDIDEDMSFNLNDIYYKTENYKAAATLRQYFGLDPSARFAVFNEVELAFASGMSNFNRPYDGDMRRLHTTSMSAELNFSPGVSVFVMKNVAFNVSFGVFGFSLKNQKEYMNDEYLGSRFTSGANFRFNIFNINFGLAVTL